MTLQEEYEKWMREKPTEPGGESVLSLKDQLAALDAKLPRVVEDTWGATEGFDIRRLPDAVRDVYMRKQRLRARLKREAADR